MSIVQLSDLFFHFLHVSLFHGSRCLTDSFISRLSLLAFWVIFLTEPRCRNLRLSVRKGPDWRRGVTEDDWRSSSFVGVLWSCIYQRPYVVVATMIRNQVRSSLIFSWAYINVDFFMKPVRSPPAGQAGPFPAVLLRESLQLTSTDVVLPELARPGWKSAKSTHLAQNMIMSQQVTPWRQALRIMGNLG